VKVLTNPDTNDMEMCCPEQSSFHLGGNLYLIAEQDGILLIDKNTMSDIYFPLVRRVQLQTTWGDIDDAVHYLEHNRYTSLDVHLGANVFVTAESPALHLDLHHYYWRNGKLIPWGLLGFRAIPEVERCRSSAARYRSRPQEDITIS
jgi:hypothetical protein